MLEYSCVGCVELSWDNRAWYSYDGGVELSCLYSIVVLVGSSRVEL